MKQLKPLIMVITLLLLTSSLVFSQSTLDCSQCHSDKNNLWITSNHSNTQNDVAEELAGEWSGLPADSVINGSASENCIACHGATAVSENGGMTEVQALNYFFSTTDGNFTDTTSALNTGEWPHVACVTCHNVLDDHPASKPVIEIFNSSNAQYHAVENVSVLCGQCHGSLRFPDTDHLRMDAWLLSKHGHGGQPDVAGELAEEWAGNTPDDVINGEEAENCIACHAPTSVMLNGGISESEALNMFFTTTDGKFTSETTVQNTSDWPEVGCNVCHNPHKPEDISLYNSTTKQYESMSSAQELCGQCHGNLRFPDTDHLSYNIESGTGGMGVADQITMPNVKCVNCHMAGGEEDTRAAMFAGHSWSVFVSEEDGSTTASCTSCHSDMDADASMTKIEELQTEFANLDSVANEKVAEAESIVSGSTDSTLIKKYEEAEFNLLYAEGDESGGVHNHKYTVLLLNDAIDKATEIITGVENNTNIIPKEFKLYQNYPNPFNPTTKIKFEIPRKSNVTITVFDALGRRITQLMNGEKAPGVYDVEFDASKYSSGIFFYKLSAANFVQVRKMVLLR